MAPAPTRNNTTMAALWESWASLVKRTPFSDTILTASTDVVKRIVLSQLHKLNYGTLVIHDTDGSKHVFGAPAIDKTLSGAANGAVSASEQAPDVELHIYSSAVWTRILFANDIGFAEAYMLGEISCTDLASFFRLCILNVAAFAPRSTILSSLTSAVAVRLYRLSNTTGQALLNAQSHYSLSNEMFAAFL